MTFWHFKVKDMKFFQLVWIVFLGALMLDCSDDQKNIRDYYFPLKQLKEGLVYEYQAIAPDSLAPYYWFYRSIIEEDRVFLTGTYYEVDLIPKQFTQEELVENGMLLDKTTTYRDNPVHIFRVNQP